MEPDPRPKTDIWMEAADLGADADIPAGVARRVISAGEFLEKTAGLSEEAACRYLPGIDFQEPVSVVRLPDSVFVRFEEQFDGIWLTDAGLKPADVRKAGQRRIRKLVTPIGPVPALQCTARNFKDSWKKEDLFPWIAPQVRSQMPSSPRNGGRQYIVLDRTRMKSV